MPNNINLSLPDGVTVKVTQPDRDNIQTTVDQGSTVSLATAVFQGADKHFTFNLNVNDWVNQGGYYSLIVNHGLGKEPSVSIVDSFNRIIIADVEYLNVNEVEIRVTAVFSGRIHFN